jgi:uncharacterized OsmC-like protein
MTTTSLTTPSDRPRSLGMTVRRGLAAAPRPAGRVYFQPGPRHGLLDELAHAGPRDDQSRLCPFTLTGGLPQRMPAVSERAEAMLRCYDELPAVQEPLKVRNWESPGSAVITLTAQARIGTENVSCAVATGRSIVEAGLRQGTGGDRSFACSGDMLLHALVACAGVTLRAVALNRDLIVSGMIKAEGDLDIRGTLGVGREAPVGFRAIRLVFELEADASDEELANVIVTTERRCVVLQTLVGRPATVVTTLQSRSTPVSSR